MSWYRLHARARASAAEGPVRLAVLPFENLGDSADDYFADGVTDAIRGKLTALPSLEIIAATSSEQYRKSSKTPQQIGQELGVHYLLVGKVRWEKAGAGQSRVQVSPELIDVGKRAATWDQPFDAPLTDVFQVQGEIATKVAKELQIALTPAAKRALDGRPTARLDAYDFYLRGQEIARRGLDATTQERAASAYAEAIKRDSSFALAWSALGWARAMDYRSGLRTNTLADSARDAAQHAIMLDPDLPEARVAIWAYYAYVRFDYARALAEAETALREAPNNSSLLTSAGYTEQQLGRSQAAITHYERAVRLDPRNAMAADLLGRIYLGLRRYAEARATLDRATSLDPENLGYVVNRIEVELSTGDLPAARAVLRRVPPTVDSVALIAFVASGNDLMWVLDSSQQRLLCRLTPDAFDNWRPTWAIVLAETYWLRGDRARARAYADSARASDDSAVALAPNDPQDHTFLGLALGYTGRREAAAREGERGVALARAAGDSSLVPYLRHQLIRIYILVDKQNQALDELELLLNRRDYWLSPAWARVDPNFAPLRGNPRFERLIAQAR